MYNEINRLTDDVSSLPKLYITYEYLEWTETTFTLTSRLDVLLQYIHFLITYNPFEKDILGLHDRRN